MGSIPGVGMAPEKKFLHFFGLLVLGSVWLKVGPEFDSECRQGYFFSFFSIWWSFGVSMDKKDVVAKPLRGG